MHRSCKGFPNFRKHDFSLMIQICSGPRTRVRMHLSNRPAKAFECRHGVSIENCPQALLPKPPERVNCILNIGFYGIGVMRNRMFENPEFSKSQCSNIDGVRQLIKRDSEVNMNLVKESCSPRIKLIRDVFKRLSLRSNRIITLVMPLLTEKLLSSQTFSQTRIQSRQKRNKQIIKRETFVEGFPRPLL